jgi:hypothetical protein
MLRDKIHAHPRWILTKYADEQAFKNDLPFDKLVIDGNLQLNEGITALMNLLAGNAEANFGNANAFLGVGDGSLSALTGTSAFTNGSAIVAGTTTLYTTEVSVGDFVRNDADDIIAEVLSVDSDLQLTLTAVYSGAGGAAAAASVMAGVAAGDTGLVGATTAYVAMEATYPQIAGQTITWRAVFDGVTANFHWREGTVANGNSNAADNLNRKIQEQGVKASGQVWTLDLQITYS